MNASTFPRWLIAAFALAMLVLLAGGAWFYRAQERHLRQQTDANLMAIAQWKAEEIAQWREQRIGDATVIMKSTLLGEAARRLLSSPDAETTEALYARFSATARTYKYRDVWLVDVEGDVRLSLMGYRGPVQEEAARAMAEAFREHRPCMNDLHSGPDNQPPHLEVVAPLFARKGEAVEPLGAVILQSEGSWFLYPLIDSWPVPTRTAETLLVRRDNDAVIFLNELRHQKDTALKLRIPSSQTEVPAVMAVLGKEGVVEGKDYRGVEVLAALKAVPDSPWFVVAKVDAAEAFAAWRSRSVLILALILGLIAASSTAMGLVWQATQKAHYEALFEAEASRRQAEERYRTTLMSVGDAVITTDSEGQIDMLNPVGEALTGWRENEARGRPLDEVFRIINEETRKAVESPVQRVLREGTVIGLGNHALLIARDGTERPVADSGAPIRDEKGKTTGVVLVFRDQTDERAAASERKRAEEALRESEQRFRLLYEQAPTAYQSLGADGNIIEVNNAWLAELGYERGDVIGKWFGDLLAGDGPALFVERFPQLKERGEVHGAEYEAKRKDGQTILVCLDGRIARDQKGAFLQTHCMFTNITERRRAEEEKKRLEAELLHAQKMEAVGRLAGGVAHDFNNMLQAILGNTELALIGAGPDSPLHAGLLEIQRAAQRSADLTRQLLAFARKQIVRPRTLDLNDAVPGTLKLLRRLIGEDIELVWMPGHDLWSVRIDPSQLDQALANLAVNARDAIPGVGRVTIETANVIFDEAYAQAHADCVPGSYVLLGVSDTGRGMDGHTIDHIFEPFFTTKEVGKGTGLGLATVYGIVRQNNGFIDVDSQLGHGTAFKIYLPRYEVETTQPPAEAAVRVAPRGSETLLIVEDEATILSIARRTFEALGYTVLTASTPTQAIRLAGEHPGIIHLLVTDVVMPEMNGRELADSLTSHRPGLKRLYISGYTADVIAQQGVLEEGMLFVQKPFTMNTLAEKVREALGR
ncbi:MAG: PAS domain S-box protein [Acidobacteriota bacterium]